MNKTLNMLIHCNMCHTQLKLGDSYEVGVGYNLCEDCFKTFIKEE